MYDKSILAKSTGASLGVVAIVGMLFLSTGTAFALPISGIGGFTISATEINGNDLVLYPAGPADGADAENTDQYPQAIVELTGTEIVDLRLEKTFDLGQYGFPDSAGNARLVITAGNNGSTVTTEGILLKTPKLGASSATFNGLTIDEDNSTSIRDTFEITADVDGSLGDDEYTGTKQGLTLEYQGSDTYGLQLENPNIRATYLTTSSITLPNLALEIQWDTNDNGQFTDSVDYGSASSSTP
jgi:hypothetical protein